MLCQKFSTLLDPLRVGIDRPDGVQRCTRYADQILADSDALFPYNIKPITAQQVIDLVEEFSIGTTPKSISPV